MHIYFLVRWKDDTKDDVAHKPWVWSTERNVYEQGAEREDMFAFGFQHTGVFTEDMLSGEPAVWDVWHWKATRTNPQGYAMDKSHHHTLEKPSGKATSYQARNGRTIWIARPEDAGDTLEKKQPAPDAYQQDRLPQYVPGTPNGSAADVLAKGRWADGWWTLEIKRRLDTGHPDDTVFDTDRTYPMAVSTHDRTGEMDKASGVIDLAFVVSEYVQNFEDATAMALPLGFRAGLTGGGPPVDWQVLENTAAASGGKVVAQLSADTTNSRYPLLILEKFEACDVDLKIMFKTISGKVDASGGLVFRYRDDNNYYVVRANSLEGNVVAYKTENGKRSNLGVKGRRSAYGVEAEVAHQEWNGLRVIAKGALFEIFLNGRKLFEVENDTFQDAGKVGLWTKADAVTHFDDLSVKSLDPDD
jgi:hypothetical protein